MNTEDFRAAVFQAISDHMAANHPTIDTAWENGPELDEALVSSVFIDVELRFYSAILSEVGQGSPSRHSGAVSIKVYAKQSTGTAEAGSVCTGLESLLKSRRFASGLTKAPQRLVPNTYKGWYSTGVLVPFTIDTK